MKNKYSPFGPTAQTWGELQEKEIADACSDVAGSDSHSEAEADVEHVKVAMGCTCLGWRDSRHCPFHGETNE